MSIADKETKFLKTKNENEAKMKKKYLNLLVKKRQMPEQMKSKTPSKMSFPKFQDWNFHKLKKMKYVKDSGFKSFEILIIEVWKEFKIKF